MHWLTYAPDGSPMTSGSFLYTCSRSTGPSLTKQQARLPRTMLVSNQESRHQTCPQSQANRSAGHPPHIQWVPDGSQI